jgi:hypothetical protein
MKQKYRKLKQLSEFAKNYKAPESEKNKNNLLSTDNGISSVTESACIRPDIFLDNDRNCDDCPYYEACRCALKRLSTSKKRKK